MIAAEKPALFASVLVLNRAYVVVHVVNVRRAFGLIYRELAEVIDLEDGSFANHDFESWLLLSDMRSDERGEHDDWVCSVNFQVQVPRVVRLLNYDRVPRQTLRFNRRNLFARDNHSCQYCGRNAPAHQLSMDHVLPRSRGGQTTWGEYCLLLRPLQHKKGWPHSARGADEPAKETREASLQSGPRAEADQPQVRKLEDVPGASGHV